MFLVSLAISLLSAVMAGNIQPLASVNGMKLRVTVRGENWNTEAETGYKKDTINRNDFGGARLNRFSVKAVRHFEKSFRNISDKHWYVLVDGFIAYFKKNDMQMKAAYDEMGNWLHTLSFYQENKLPRDVRQLIKREYYDYSIYLVAEIDKDNKIIYLVKMENENSLITVRVWEDEMEEIENYRKSF